MLNKCGCQNWSMYNGCFGNLQNGPKQISTVTKSPKIGNKESPKAARHEPLASIQQSSVHPVQPVKTGATTVSLGPTKSKEELSTEGRPVSSESIDVLEKARAAIAAADRASSAARAAAQLVNLNFNEKGISNST